MAAYLRTIAVIASATALLASQPGCAGQRLEKLPKCDGGGRRDANPHGSVLPGAPRPATTAPATAGKPIAEAPARQLDRQAQRLLASYASC